MDSKVTSTLIVDNEGHSVTVSERVVGGSTYLTLRTAGGQAVTLDAMTRRELLLALGVFRAMV